EDMFASFLDGSKSASEAFADFARNLQRIAAQILAERAIQYLFNLFGGGRYGYNPANYSDSAGRSGMGGFARPTRSSAPAVLASPAPSVGMPSIASQAARAAIAPASRPGGVQVEVINNGTP